LPAQHPSLLDERDKTSASISFPNWFNWTNPLDLWVWTLDLWFMAGATPKGVTVPGDERKKE
jgi:hypothetical protein